MTSNGEITYFIRLNSFVKIGKTTHLKAKVDVLQHASPYELELLGVTLIPEKELHDKFDHLRERGEWFHLTYELREFIDAEITRTNTVKEEQTQDRMTEIDKGVVWGSTSETILGLISDIMLRDDTTTAHIDEIIRWAEQLHSINKYDTEVAIARLVQEAKIFEPVRYSRHYTTTDADQQRALRRVPPLRCVKNEGEK